MNTSDLIHPRHLNRRALIYVRQSTPQQVATRLESQRLQYALRDRAVDLGWLEQDIEVIDADLGASGTDKKERVGFQHLVSEVALGKVGVVIAYDATRLARNCTHWYELLDLCGRADCLIADRDGVYDSSSINGRLLLGLKGQISELELHTIRARLLAGKMSKAERGELAVTLPVGLVRQEDGAVEKHADREVQGRISLIFRMLLEKKSVCQLVRYLNQQSLTVPSKDRNRPNGISWRRANIANVGNMVRNPAYAGAYVYGRRSLISRGNSKKSNAILPRDQWHVCLQGRYPSYVSWKIFERIESMLHDNYAEYDRQKSRGVPRDGTNLLQGIIYCGKCGHKMCVQYKGGAQYLCNRLRQICPSDPVCQRFASSAVDDQVVQWFFEALSVVQIDASQEALKEFDEQHELVTASRRQQLARLRYEAQRAERQYQLADPENRLVTSELEQRWECAMQELRREEERQAEVEESKSCWSVPDELLNTLKDVGRRLPELWEQDLFTTAQKKTLLRSLIDKVVVQRVGGSKGDQVHVRVVWRGGACTSGDVLIHVAKFSQLRNASEMEQSIVRLSKEGHSAREIARQLTEQGFRSPKSSEVLKSTVYTVLKRNGIMNLPKSRPVKEPGCLTISQLAKRLGIRRQWFLEQIFSGAIQVEKTASRRCYLFPDNQKTLDDMRQLHEGKTKKLVY